LTSFVGGYTSGSFYLQNGGTAWIPTALITAAVYPLVIFVIGFFLDFLAMYYNTLTSIPIGTMVILLLLWLFISVPLSFFGTIIGRNTNGKPNFPTRLSQVPRQIPDMPWYAQRWVYILLGGLLPFGSIFIEMYFVFSSYWQYKYYYVYGFILVVFIILSVVLICVSIVSAYFLLSSEDYRWHWVSLLSGAVTGLYVYLYCIYYFFAKTHMHGLMQTMFYFGYMLLFCFTISLICAGISYFGARIFVYQIYKNLHID